MERQRSDPLHGFYRPFFETRFGHLFVLSAPKDHVRDGLAAMLIARHFPLPEFEKIQVEPTRPSIMPRENIILVGRTKLFVGPESANFPGRGRILPIGYARLGRRLEAIEKACCYVFEGDPRIIKNSVTGTVFSSAERDEFDREVDHAVIRRVFQPGFQNTISFEGNHGLGTLAAAMVGTSSFYLSEIGKAISEIDGYDHSVPLEILVRGSFDGSAVQNVYTTEAIEVRLLNIVYNRRWIYDMADGRWIDQHPCDIRIELRGAEIVAPDAKGAASTSASAPPPSLEVEADLRKLRPEARELCRRLLEPWGARARSTKPADRRARTRLLEVLTAGSDSFRLTLREENAFGGIKVRELSTNPGETRLQRKRFLLHLVFCLMLGEGFVCLEPEIRRHFPEFCRRKRRSGQTLIDAFGAAICGRMRDGFLPLLGEVRKSTQYLRILHDKKEKTYWIRLLRLTIVVKLRLLTAQEGANLSAAPVRERRTPGRGGARTGSKRPEGALARRALP